MKMKSKKALSTMQIILLIVAIITFLFILTFSNQALSDSKYEASLLECQLFFESVDGKPFYFGNELNEPTFNLFDSISNLCMSKEAMVYEKDVSNAVELVDDCWKKTGSGVDIYGVNARDSNFCVFCGFVTAKDEIDNFNEKFVSQVKLDSEKYSFLKNSSESASTNQDFLLKEENIPQSLNEEEPLMVFYYTYKPKFEGGFFGETATDVAVAASELTGSFGGALSTINYYISSEDERTITGVIIEPWEKIDDLDTEFNNRNDDPTIKVESKSLNCQNFVVPINN